MSSVVYRASATQELDFEGELAVIIGKKAVRVTSVDALRHVFGYTIANDISARDAQFSDGQWTRGKSMDTFCPLGPTIVSADEIPDPQALKITTRVNGEVMQSASTSEMIFPIADIISYISQTMTLMPGDVILTGTPEGVGMGRTPQKFLKGGDVVSVAISGIGELSNSVVEIP
jgi:2-keto-4-pentenoate hydratase/2-oxohepta-3-ene-1,7-dioic acid hydratase in catechol pathway